MKGEKKSHIPNYQDFSSEQCGGGNVCLLRTRLFGRKSLVAYFLQFFEDCWPLEAC